MLCYYMSLGTLPLDIEAYFATLFAPSWSYLAAFHAHTIHYNRHKQVFIKLTIRVYI